jgi:hypothetical protein
MQYILFIYSNEAEFNQRSPEQIAAMRSEYMQFTQEIKASGHLRAGDRLESVTTATTVRVRDGKVLKSDGPFAETREQLGGYYIVEAENLDQAVAMAARVPGARIGSIEVRPITKMPTA